MGLLNFLYKAVSRPSRVALPAHHGCAVSLIRLPAIHAAVLSGAQGTELCARAHLLF